VDAATATIIAALIGAIASIIVALITTRHHRILPPAATAPDQAANARARPDSEPIGNDLAPYQQQPHPRLSVSSILRIIAWILVLLLYVLSAAFVVIAVRIGDYVIAIMLAAAFFAAAHFARKRLKKSAS
jgi:hypothetical protein